MRQSESFPTSNASDCSGAKEGVDANDPRVRETEQTLWSRFLTRSVSTLPILLFAPLLGYVTNWNWWSGFYFGLVFVFVAADFFMSLIDDMMFAIKHR